MEVKTLRRANVVMAGAFSLAAVVALGCADWDNPTALSDLQTETQFDVEATRVETFEEVEIHVPVMEGGSRMGMREARLEIEHEGGDVRVMEMEPEGDGYAAHVMFFEAGEHHLHFIGRPDGHHVMGELGDMEIEVHRRHQVIGPYWVELEVSPAPVLEGEEGHIHALVFELLEDGSPGDPVSGLEVEMAIHDLNAVETILTVAEEEAGAYEASYTFGEAGVYELHLEIEVGLEHEEGEFHIPVLAESTEDDVDDHDDGGDDHGHGHGG